MEYQYLNGELSSEAVAGALPKRGNNPQKCSLGLYSEQISGTAFTVARKNNLRSWMYRIRPSVMHGNFALVESEGRLRASFDSHAPGLVTTPNQLRWGPYPMPKESGVDFISGLTTLMGAGDPARKEGMSVHMYAFNAPMAPYSAFSSSDGDMLIVPQLGTLILKTEFGVLKVPPRSIAVVQRGIKFHVKTEGVDEEARGYVCEVAGHWVLPDLGLIGANGLANPRDIRYPVAAYDEPVEDFQDWVITNKFMGQLFQAPAAHSPFNVVAWHGNYVPFLYDLEQYCTMNSVSFDHPDPSIYTVLTCPSDEPGVAIADFVIFPPRWMVQEETFRPPYFHRNTMTEFMGMIYGKYDAKKGFMPGGASLHSCMTPHGPDTATFLGASTAELKPVYFDAGLAFMFETKYMLRLTEAAANADHLDKDYQSCWEGFPVNFRAL